MILGRNFEERRKGFRVGVYSVADTFGDLQQRSESLLSASRVIVVEVGVGRCESVAKRKKPSNSTYMLVDQHYSNIFTMSRETIECLLDEFVLCLVVDNQIVFLGVGPLSNMLFKRTS